MISCSDCEPGSLLKQKYAADGGIRLSKLMLQ